MKILKACAKKQPAGYYIPYRLQVEVIELPDRKTDLIYEKKVVRWTGSNRDTSLYFAENDGYVSFFAYSGPDTGYGGASFHLLTKQENGSIKEETLIGPWSSNSSSMARAGFPASVPVSWQGYIAGEFTLTKAQEILKEFDIPYEYRLYKNWDGKEEENHYALYPK